MKTYRSVFCAAVLTFLTLSCFAQQSSPAREHVSVPGKDWGVFLDLTGYSIKDVETKPDGRRYMMAQNERTMAVVSLTLEQVSPGGHNSSCRESLEDKTKHSPMKISDVRFSRSDDVDVMRYTVKEFKGQKVNQESLFACQFYDNTYVDLHVSKVQFAAADEPLFVDVLKSMRIEKVQKSSADLVAEASRFYLQHDYKGAIGPYARALELEKTDPKLGKTAWYVLVDNLGMSYGISGDLKNAKQTFEYGISKDPTYPMFYYNLACTYAEMGDASQATDNLKKAFENKANTIAGESMPDPRTDDSFQKLMKNREFRELAESLSKSR
jgi:hypothetical protein